MKRLQSTLTTFALLSLAGCASLKTPILTAPAVSMTDNAFEHGYKGKSLGEVTSRYCPGDDPISSSKDDANIGLMDEVVMKAQKQSGARYISSTTFFTQGSCMVLEGTAIQ